MIYRNSLKISSILLYAVGLPCLFPTPSAAFLPPDLGAGESSPTLERQGQTLPLRPEMLPPVPPATSVPVIQPTKLSNGITTFIREDRSLPRVDFIFLIRAGSISDQPGKEGLAELTGEVIRSGGSQSRKPSELDTYLESMGSSLEVSTGQEGVTLRLFALSNQAEKAFAAVSELIQKPAFDPDALDTRRGVLVDGVLRQDDDPSGVARRTFRRVVYGGGHPLARTPTTHSLLAISREDLRAHHKAYYQPHNILIGVTGDIGNKQASDLIAQHWGQIKPSPKPTKWPVPTEDKAWDTTSGVVLLPKRVQQTQIRVGHLGLPRRHPDRYAVNLLNTVFGTGGFSSRMMDRVRSMKGLAYGAGGGIQSDQPVGLFSAAASTQARTTVAALREILAIIQETSKGDITAAELEIARRDLIYSFLAGFNTPTAILQQSMTAHFAGESEDYLPGFLERIQKVTLDEVNEAARKHMHPDRLKILLVGFEKAFEKPVDEFGPVTRLLPDGSLPSGSGLPLPPEGRSPAGGAPVE